LQDLGDLSKTTPISNQLFSLPSSVFVSAGRYSEYLPMAFIVALGTAGYLLLHTRRDRRLVFLVIGLLGTAAFLSGNRSCLVSCVMTAVVLPLGFLWGAPRSWKGQYRMVKAIRRSVLVAAMGLGLIFLVFPSETGSRLAFYAETLLPSSSAYQLSERTWDYPVQNFLDVFRQPNWGIGNGIGTASLGTQYVARLTGRPAPKLGVEEGYGTLIVEMGAVAPLLWILWTGALIYHSWKVVRVLRGTRFLPLGIAILWYSVLLLFIWTFGALAGYENYTCNVFLWLLVGVLFRLPHLLKTPQSPMLVPVEARPKPDDFEPDRRFS